MPEEMERLDNLHNSGAMQAAVHLSILKEIPSLPVDLEVSSLVKSSKIESSLSAQKLIRTFTGTERKILVSVTKWWLSVVKAGIEKKKKMLRVVALSKLVLAVLSPSCNVGIVEDDVCFRERTVF